MLEQYIGKTVRVTYDTQNEITSDGRYKIFGLVSQYHTFMQFMNGNMEYRYFPGGYYSRPGVNIVFKDDARSDTSVQHHIRHNVVWQNRTVGGVRFTKRVSKAYYDFTGYKLPSHILTEIGNIADIHSMKNVELDVTFTHDLHWEAGDWNDDGSCYWGDYIYARPSILASGGGAVLVKKDDGTRWGRHLGRAWFIDNFCGENSVAIFNSTVNRDGLYLPQRKLAMLINTLLKCDHVYELEDSSPEAIYINEGLAVIGNHRISADLHDWVADYDDSYYTVWCTCDWCSCDIRHEDDAKSTYEYTVCEDCFRNEFDGCAECGYHHPHDEMTEGTDGGTFYCERCVRRSCDVCEDCQLVIEGDAVSATSGKYCEDCAEGHETCDQCGDIALRLFDAVVETRDNVIGKVCRDCL